ncbi:hypothetical protein [Maricaulis sp.]|uniref:hypothetical protein n=1 Tax=Maricaulis sp. TaxID=1486257 RepID=UPI00262BC517|nr:hypothetical protein [Maricaulis sp.]
MSSPMQTPPFAAEGIPPGHVLHIGAGYGDMLPVWLDLKPQRITLVEPDPDTLAELRARAEPHARVQVVAAAVTPDPARSVLHRFNFAELNSLTWPTGIRDLYPGLEAIGEETVTARDPVELVRGLDLDPGAAHLLVIDAPGVGLAVLKALQGAGLLARFAALRIRTGRKALYEGEATLDEITAWLKGAGHGPVTLLVTDDPDRPFLQAPLSGAGQAGQAQDASAKAKPEKPARPERKTDDATAEELARLKAAVTRARHERGHARGSLTRQIGKTEKALADLAAARDRIAELEDATRTLDAEHASRGEEIAQLRETLETRTAELEAALARIAELKKVAQAQGAELERHKTRLAELEETGKRLQGDLDARTRDFDARTAERDALKADADRLGLSREDMHRAEGQIELIRDLLLRGPEI